MHIINFTYQFTYVLFNVHIICNYTQVSWNAPILGCQVWPGWHETFTTVTELLGDLLGEGASQYVTCIDDIPTFLLSLGAGNETCWDGVFRHPLIIIHEGTPKGRSRYTLYRGFLKWWYPQNTPKWSFLVWKPWLLDTTILGNTHILHINSHLGHPSGRRHGPCVQGHGDVGCVQRSTAFGGSHFKEPVVPAVGVPVSQPQKEATGFTKNNRYIVLIVQSL